MIRAALTGAAGSKETGVCKRAELPPTWAGRRSLLRARRGRGGGGGRGEQAPPRRRRALPKELPEAAQAHQHPGRSGAGRVREGQLDAARGHVEEARRAAPALDARIEARLLEVDGHLALARGDAEAALRSFEGLARVAGGAALTGAQLLAAIGRARAVDALGRTGARAAYQEAERLVDGWARLVPVGRIATPSSPATTISSRAIACISHGQRGTAAEAAEAARRSRSGRSRACSGRRRSRPSARSGRFGAEARPRLTRTERDALENDAKGDWGRPADELGRVVVCERTQGRAPRPTSRGTLVVLLGGAVPAERGRAPDPANDDLLRPASGSSVYHPIRRGWAGFAITASGTVQRALPGLDAGAPAAQSLRRRDALGLRRGHRRRREDPLPRLRRPRRAPSPRPALAGPAAARALAPIEYGLDLPGRVWRCTPVRAHPLASSSRSLGHFSSAHAEAQLVLASMRARGAWACLGSRAGKRRSPPCRARCSAPIPQHFHYAGHGHFGEGEEESALSLADNGSLSVNDVLTLPRAPRFVVLSGCETAGAAGRAMAQGLGLAQAFLVSGVSTAVAATRRVDDHRTGRLMATFYGALLPRRSR